MRQKVYFRADAGLTTGYGHFIRSLALADMLKDDFDCKFFTQEPTDYQRQEMDKVCPWQALREDTKMEDFLNLLQGDEIVVLDNYFYTTDYQRAIKAKGCKLVCIDDMHDKHYVSDILINHSLRSPSLFDVEPYTRLLLGYDWALLRAPFLRKYDEQTNRKGIVVCLGGSDPNGLTSKVIRLLIQLGKENITVVAGDKVKLDEDVAGRVEVRRRLSAQEMASLFESKAVAIVPASSVCIEALSRGLHVVAGYFVDNQVEVYAELMASDRACGVGDMNKLTAATLSHALQRAESHKSQPFDTSSIKVNYIEAFKSLCR